MSRGGNFGGEEGFREGHSGFRGGSDHGGGGGFHGCRCGGDRGGYGGQRGSYGGGRGGVWGSGFGGQGGFRGRGGFGGGGFRGGYNQGPPEEVVATQQTTPPPSSGQPSSGASGPSPGLDVLFIEPTVSSGERLYYCCVRGCQSRFLTNKDGLWLFALPEDPEHWRIWNQRLSICHEHNRPESPRVCFRHFKRGDFVGWQCQCMCEFSGLRLGALPKNETRRLFLPR